MGIPKGDKPIQKFNVPKWISSSKRFSREYLKIAYFCEGSNKEGKRKNPRIKINTAKDEEIIDSGIEFMNTLRMMLKKFNIETTKCALSNRRVRKRDNKVTRDIKFRIKVEDNNRFIKEIGWFK